MFEIHYRILEKPEELKAIKITNINERNNIYGFMHLTCNKSEVGFLIEKSQLSDEETIEKGIFLYNDLLCTWFEDMLEVLKNINTNKYVVLNEIDVADSYLEFSRDTKDILKVRYLEIHDFMDKMTVGEKNRLQDRQIAKINWKEEILFSDFKKEVIGTSKRFIEEVLSINPIWQNNDRIMEIRNLIREIEETIF